jgi:hypothetical protein
MLIPEIKEPGFPWCGVELRKRIDSRTCNRGLMICRYSEYEAAANLPNANHLPPLHIFTPVSPPPCALPPLEHRPFRIPSKLHLFHYH